MEMRFDYNSDQVAMYRVKTLRWFERIIRALLERHEKPYRLFISYKNRHRVKKLADRCFMWDETEETRDGIDVESGEQGFGDTRLIADEEIGRGGKDMLCRVYLRGRLAEQFKMRRKIFDRIFAQGWQVK